MKKNRVLGVLFTFLLVGAASWMVAGLSEAAAKPGDSVVVYDDPSLAEQGKVEFSHPGHKAAFGQEKLDCKPCHVTDPPRFSMKKPKEGETRTVIKMAEMEQGKACGACHNGKTEMNGKVAFDVTSKDNCSKCHHK